MKKNLIGLAVFVLIFAGVAYVMTRNNKPAEKDAVQTETAVQSKKPAETEPAAETPAANINNEEAPADNQNNNSNPAKNMQHTITIKTNLGEIKFATYDADAPKTVENFITLANKKFYDGVVFHRVIDGFMIQGGDPTGTGTGGPGYQFEDELNPQTESYQAGYKKGTVAMANAGPNTNGSQFFIMVADYPLPNNYTIFGKVISGQDVADKIAKVAKDSSDKPLEKVVMEKVTVADAPAQ